MSKTEQKKAKGRPWRRTVYWQSHKYSRVRRSGGKGCRYAARNGRAK